jgi:hypothetical protein
MQAIDMYAKQVSDDKLGSTAPTTGKNKIWQTIKIELDYLYE